MVVLASTAGCVAATDEAELGEANARSPRSSSDPRVVVKFRRGTPAATRADLIRVNGHEVDRTNPELDMHVVRVPRGKSVADAVERYRRHPLIEYAEAETFMELAAVAETPPSDPWFVNNQGALRIVRAEETWLNVTTGSADIPIGIIDTGLNRTHFEFANATRAITGYDFLDGDEDYEDTNNNGHGTLIAGVIGAETDNSIGIAGATWDNPLVIMRSGLGIDAVWAIEWAANHGVRVINMSFGAGIESSVFRDACQYAFDRGVVLVGAAGNAGTSSPTYPAAYPTVLAVTGVRSDGTPTGYNWGDWVDLSAPGGGVATTYPLVLDADGIGYSGGTSISTPFVSAAAGLVLSVRPDLTARCVMDILTSTADDIGAAGFDVYTGHGRVNFYKAAVAAQTWDCATPVDTTAPTVAINEPASGAVLCGTSRVLVDANDNVRVMRVDLYRDGAFASSDTVAPHEWWMDTTTLAEGAHKLHAIAFDAAGNRAESARVSITVDNTPACASASDCGDGDACTQDACVSGSCMHAAVSCSDSNACTTDRCDASLGCVFQAISGCTKCGNGTCESGETCSSCLSDCPGRTGGKVARRYCCGDGARQWSETTALCDGNY